VCGPHRTVTTAVLPELWASPEATVARISESRRRDQLDDTGHLYRESDLDLIADLGVAASRYPVLWEHVEPRGPGERRFAWADRRLHGLIDRGVEPIVTLLHHGSGPYWTNLFDPSFATHFAEYAASVARRYPWVKRWNPINEPLTTARFSTLYGAWYPNRVFDHGAFGRAVINQVTAILRAMERISDVIPDARFMLTEDLQSFTAGHESRETYVAHKRERMYLSCELLQGRVVPGHPMHAYLVEDGGIAAAELLALSRRSRPPDLMGWDYYPNSERWLGRDGTHETNLPLVDVAPSRLNMRRLLRNAYARLGLPIALAKVHVIGNERERARWMLQRLDDALTCAAAGVPIVAFGAWAAFGLLDWTSLLCAEDQIKEDGVYTFAGKDGIPQSTLVAGTLRELARGRIPDKPDELGWWERMSRAPVLA